MSERADHLGMEREKACSSILPFIRFHHFNHNNSYRPRSKRRPALADRFLHGDGRAQQQQAPRRPRLLHAAPAPPICASRRPRRPPWPPTARRRRPRTRTRRGPSTSISLGPSERCRRASAPQNPWGPFCKFYYIGRDLVVIFGNSWVTLERAGVYFEITSVWWED